MMTVWVIDDDSALLTMIKEALTYQGWSVETFSSLEAAHLAYEMRRRRPDVVLADWSIPGGPPLSLVHLMSDVPMIVMSGDPAVEQQLPDHVRWLSKPFRLAHIYDVIAGTVFKPG